MKELNNFYGMDNGFEVLMDESDWEAQTLRSFQEVFSGGEPEACRNLRGSRDRICIVR